MVDYRQCASVFGAFCLQEMLMVRKWSFSILITLTASLVLFVSAAQALTILNPTDGSIVREKVKIAVPQSAIPSGGFMSILVDNRFQGCVSAPSGGDTKPVVYWWDTKVQFVDLTGKLKDADRWVKDGEHQIEVVIHNANSAKIDSKKITVYVKNKVAQTNPAPPVKVYYKYNVGELSKYHVKVRGDMVDSTGNSVLGGEAAFTSEYDIGQWVEDVRPDGTALVRYRLLAAPEVTIMGQVVPQAAVGMETVQVPASLYKIVDKYGRVINPSVFHKALMISVSDVIIPLPGRPMRVGDSWQGAQRIKLEGIGSLLKFSADYQLASLEWDSGRECAKLSASLGGPSIKLNLPGEFTPDENAKLKGNSEVFFGLKSGKIIRSNSILEMAGSVDSSQIGNLANAASMPTQTGTPGSLIMGETDENGNPISPTGAPGTPGVLGGVANPYNPTAGPMPGMPGYGPTYGAPSSGTTATGAARTKVKVRITSTMEIR